MIDHDVLYCNCFVIHWADCHLYNYYFLVEKKRKKKDSFIVAKFSDLLYFVYNFAIS